MIDHDGRAWLSLLVRLRGSVIPRLLPRIAVAACIGAGAVLAR